MILIVPEILAIGISPGRRTFDFEPGAVHEVVLNIHKGSSDEYLLKVDGELAEYIELEKDKIVFASNEKIKQVKYVLEIPEMLASGIRQSSIRVLSDEKDVFGRTKINVLPSVISQVWIKVPYSGKKLAIENIEVIEPRTKEVVTIRIAVENIGDEILNKVTGMLTVIDPEDNEVIELETNEVNDLEPGKRAILETKWVPDILPGNYELKAMVEYDKFKIEQTTSFVLGEPIILVKRIESENFKLGGIVDIGVIIESKWNEEIEDVHADIFLKKDNYHRTIRTTSVDLVAGQEEKIEAYWDTSDAVQGNYDLTVKIYALDKVIKNLFTISVTDDNMGILKQITGAVIEKDKTPLSRNQLISFIAYAIIILFVKINLIWFFMNMKKRKQ